MPSRAGHRPRLSVVIPTRDTRALTLDCLSSLEQLGAPEAELEVVVVDEASRDGTAAAVRDRFPGVRVLRNEHSIGFTAAANRGLSATGGEILLLLNSDTETAPGGWRLLDAVFRRRSSLGVAGAQLHFAGEEPQWSGGREPGAVWLFGLASGLPPLLARLPGLRALRPVRGWRDDRVDWVTGAAMAIRREAWEECGPFDPAFHLYCQDLDFCTRVRSAGWEVDVVPGFRVLHHQGATIGRRPGAAGAQDPELLWSELVRWAAKHGGPSRGRRAARALRWGGRLRLAVRRLAGPFVGRSRRHRWQRDTLAYERALAAIRREADAVEPPPT